MEKKFVLIVGTACLLLAVNYLVLIEAPLEVTMGLVQKIFYYHMPLAWWSFFAFFLVFIFSISYLWTRKEEFDWLAASAAEVGVLFSTLVLVTGIIWAKASWNTWWTWDPRLSTALVMWFMYSAYLIVRRNFQMNNKQRVVCSVLGILAFVDVPLVFLSARMWRSIHPSVLASQEGGLPSDMLKILAISILAWGGLFFCLFILRWEQLKMKAKLKRLIVLVQSGI